ncbi:MAG: type I restriction enzyme HsdR N-terminal domain-containing protein [Paludibacteraceae bacterium]|nr:type I restriction enzyme HsdR N-terminal domain-containing protein [Paludibacteraceae bacterium]
MDFKDSIKQLAKRAGELKNNLQTEEATKNALIMPFIQTLGYDVFNPLEVVPEMDCDLTKKKGEKIDYAIMKDGETIMVIECKHWQQSLDIHKAQLARYFVASKAKFGLLTNGIEYRFYTDLVKTNLMDEVPFLEFNIEQLKEAQIKSIEKFTKENFDVDNIMNSASELKFVSEVKKIIKELIENPNPDFVKMLAKQVYPGNVTSSVLTQFTDIVKKAGASYVNDKISERLNIVVQTNEAEQQKVEDTPVEVPGAKKDSEVVTTLTEMEAYYIVKSILREVIPGERVTMRDAISYCSIFIDDNNRKPVCRLHFNNESNLRLEPVGEDGKGEKYKIESLDEIYKYADQLIEAAKRYI